MNVFVAFRNAQKEWKKNGKEDCNYTYLYRDV